MRLSQRSPRPTMAAGTSPSAHSRTGPCPAPIHSRSPPARVDGAFAPLPAPIPGARPPPPAPAGRTSPSPPSAARPPGRGTSLPGAFERLGRIPFLHTDTHSSLRPPPPELPLESREPSHRTAGRNRAGGTESGSAPARGCHVGEGVDEASRVKVGTALPHARVDVKWGPPFGTRFFLALGATRRFVGCLCLVLLWY